MSIVTRETADLFDDATGSWVGVVDLNGKEQRVVPPGAAGLAGVTSGGALVGPDGQPVGSGGSSAIGTIPAAQIIAGTLGSYTAETTYLTADTSGGVDKGTLVRWSNDLAAWVFDFYRSAAVL